MISRGFTQQQTRQTNNQQASTSGPKSSMQSFRSATSMRSARSAHSMRSAQSVRTAQSVRSAQSMRSARSMRSAGSVLSSLRSTLRSTLKSGESFVRESIARHKEKARDEASQRRTLSESSIPEVGVRARIKYVVKSAWFAIAMAFLILMNVILLGVEVDVGKSLLYASEVPSWFAIFNQVIAAWQFQCDPG